MKLDPVTLEIISRKLVAITDEVYFTVQRTARSSFVNEVADFAVAFLDVNGDVFAYPPSASFNFLIDTDFKSTIDAVPDLQPGDVIITNDPYTSFGLATHIPDVHLIQPYFHDGKILGYGWSFIHSLDFGGAVSGSVAAANHEIYQEGLRIPPMKLRKGDAMNEELLTLIRLNTRMADTTIADFKAMLGALETGRRRYGDVIARFGVDTVLQAQIDLLDYAEARARVVLRRIPDGVYDFWDYLDDDVVTGIPLRVRLRMEVKDGEVLLDLTDTDPETPSAFNVPTFGQRTYWLSFRLTGILTTYDPDIPRNAGLYRSISVRNQPASVFDARPPAAVGNRNSASYRLFDCVTGAILQANPALMPAAMGGSMAIFRYTEQLENGSVRTEVVEPLRSGMGALASRDGVDARDNSINNMRNRPAELIEMEQGLRILSYDINKDSGGPGRMRGGVGQMFVVEVTGEAGGVAQISGLERSRMAPWGFAGGKPGALVRAIVNEGKPDERLVTKGVPIRLSKGDTITLRMPGGGGIGNPFERDPAAVEADVRCGFVSAALAERDYGVAIVDGKVDAEATAALRRGKAEATNEVFSFGAQRDAWEKVFTDEAMREFNRRLYASPRTRRHQLRSAVFSHVAPGLFEGGHAALDSIVADPAAARALLSEALDRFLPRASA